MYARVDASKSVRECVSVCVWGGDKHLSPEAAFRFPLTSSVKSAQSLHCHLPATRERPAPHTDKLICLAAHTHIYIHTRTCSYIHACAQALTRIYPQGFPLSPKIELKQTHHGRFFNFFFLAGEGKCFLLDSYPD